MCEGSHYKPPSMQEETFMFNDLSLETLGDVALITGQSPSWKGPNSVFRKPMLTQTGQGYFRKVFMTKYYLSDKKRHFWGCKVLYYYSQTPVAKPEFQHYSCDKSFLKKSEQPQELKLNLVFSSSAAAKKRVETRL